MKLKIFTTGGTIDKIYFDAKSEYQIGDPQIGDVLREANVSFPYSVEPLLRKDSLELTEADRDLLRKRIQQADAQRILVTHGTDTMADTGRFLKSVTDKTIVLVGAMQPARFRMTDAIFNIGAAVMAAQTLPSGVYIAMNGQVFDPDNVQKNRDKMRFETT